MVSPACTTYRQAQGDQADQAEQEGQPDGMFAQSGRLKRCQRENGQGKRSRHRQRARGKQSWPQHLMQEQHDESGLRGPVLRREKLDLMDRTPSPYVRNLHARVRRTVGYATQLTFHSLQNTADDGYA